MKSISLCFILLLFVCFALVQASIVPPVCSYASEQANVNYTLCNFMDSDTSWCGTQVAVVPMSDPYFPCDDYLSHCVQAPPSLHANSPSCSPDPSGDPNKAKCNYLKHSVPFEIYCNTSYQSISEPVQYLALFSQDEVSFTDMQHETILYRASIYGDSTILGVSVVSPTNFTNNAYIVALTTEDIRVYFASVSYYGTFNIRPCVAQQSGIIQMDTIYDARSNTTVLVGLTRGGLATFAPINITNGCPALYTKTWQFLSPDNSVNVAQIQRIGFVSQLEPNHNQDVSYGCFPALSSRTLVYLYTPTLVFIYGYSAAAPSTNITLTAANAIYNVALISNTSNITALSIFGECFGNVNAPSQMLWLSMAVYDSRSNISSLKLVSLNEFSLSPFGCDANDSLWWARPASHRSDCGLVTTICQNKNYFVDSTGVCQSRQIGTISLNSSADHIIHRMQTTPYNTEGDFFNFAHLLFSYKSSDIYLTVNAFQEIACNTTTSNSSLVLQTLTTVGVGRKLDSVHISENGQHVFIAYPKQQWEITANSRFLNICTILSSSSSPPSSPPSSPADFLAPYNDSCNSLQPAPFTTYDYMLYFSPCAGGTSCWRYGNYKDLNQEDWQNMYVGYPVPSNFAIRPTSQYTCGRGFYCPGQGVRQICLAGYVCPNTGLISPIPCTINTNYDTTCTQVGLIAPAPCPDGMICILPAASPVPAPPGYYVTPRNRSIFYECAPGDWCAMSRSNVTNGLKADLNCSVGTFCGITNVTIPTPCVIKNVNGQNVTEYCPEGTVTPSLCAAGFYCPTPFQQLECYESYYCPNGSVQMDLCPGGYYCPTPTEKIKCPSGHYCREASIAPQKCHPLVLCPAGTVSEKFAVSGVLFDIGVVVVLLGGYVIGLKIRDKLRKKRDEKRAQKKRKNRKSARINLKPKTNTITFRFENLGLELHENKKKVLEGVTGTIRAGRVTAVMGPSGAGKTTFLTTLAGKAYYGTRTGKVFINDVQADIQDFKKVVGFVPQEDIMHRVLTVKEIISFNAEVRLPSSLSAQQKTDICNEVITVLGLWDIRHQPIGDETTRGISGGQRKRVNIGMELVADPTVIFLDEPTSGLDSTSSEEVVACLQRVAELGLTIVTVLHQPRYEIFQMFHDVLLLGKGGRTVYIGKSDEALGYFQSLGFKCPKHTNPPDFFMDVISGRVQREGYPDFNPTDLFDLWEQRNANFGRQSSQLVDFVSVNSHEDDDLDGAESAPLLTNAQTNKDVNRKTAGFFKQLFLFTARALVQQTRDLRGFFWDNVLIVIAGSLLGALYIDQPYKGPVAPALAALCPSFIANVCALPQTDKLNAMGSLVSLSIGFTAMAASLRCFGTEKVVFWRESAAGINKVAYFLGKNIAQLVNITLAPLVFLSIFYTLTSPRAPLWTYYETLLLLQFAVVGVGYFVSIVLTYSNAQLTGVVIALVWAMFGGANPPLKELKQNILMHIAASLSPYRWSQEALYISEITRYDEIYDVETSVAYWGFDLNNRDNDLIALLAYGLVARLFALICLMVLNRDKML